MIPWIGLASDLGGNRVGSAAAPLFLREHLPPHFDCRTIVLPDLDVLERREALTDVNRKLASWTFDLAKRESFFFSVGGDHSSAIGMWSGIAHALRPQGDLGLIWFDAHMDAHTPSTSPSGNIHGMPLAVLLGHGDADLTGILDPLPKIKPENLVLIGVRSFEPGEAELLKALNVRIYFMEEVFSRGIETVLKEAIEIVSRRTVGYGMSFDLDGIDPFFVSAVGTPVPFGVDPEALLASFSLFKKFPPLAFELVEYNPSLDATGDTLAFIQKLVKTAAFPLQTSAIS